MEDKFNILKLKEALYNEKQKNYEERLKKAISVKSRLEIDFGRKDKQIGFKQSIINFFKSEYFEFMMKYLFFMIVFTLCFYVLFHINNNTDNKVILYETKIFYYAVVFLILIIINDLIEVPQENLFYFVLLIFLSLVSCYYAIELLNKYNHSSFNKKGLLVIGSSAIIGIITIIIFSVGFKLRNKFSAYNLMHSFNKAISKNLAFIIFILIYVYFYHIVYRISNWKNKLSDILSPTILGSVLLFFVFCFFVFIAIKMKIINKIQILNSFIAFLSIVFFIGILNLYIFTNSLNSVCVQPVSNKVDNSNNTERLNILIFISLFIILWLRDTRTWHQIGSILFILASCIALLTMFYYSTIYPSIALLSFWLFIEWMIIIFNNKENSKNSFHHSFMNV
jgi:hypothetical protein